MVANSTSALVSELSSDYGSTSVNRNTHKSRCGSALHCTRSCQAQRHTKQKCSVQVERSTYSFAAIPDEYVYQKQNRISEHQSHLFLVFLCPTEFQGRTA